MLAEDRMAERTIHIVGLQKSGTSLLVHLLENTHQAQFLDGRGKPRVIFDVGGGTGVYACRPVKQGYEVHLVDPVHGALDRYKQRKFGG